MLDAANRIDISEFDQKYGDWEFDVSDLDELGSKVEDFKQLHQFDYELATQILQRMINHRGRTSIDEAARKHKKYAKQIKREVNPRMIAIITDKRSMVAHDHGCHRRDSKKNWIYVRENTVKLRLKRILNDFYPEDIEERKDFIRKKIVACLNVIESVVNENEQWFILD